MFSLAVLVTVTLIELLTVVAKVILLLRLLRRFEKVHYKDDVELLIHGSVVNSDLFSNLVTYSIMELSLLIASSQLRIPKGGGVGGIVSGLRL